MQNFTKLAAAALFLTAGLAANAQGLQYSPTVSPSGEFQSIYNMNSISLEWGTSTTFEFADEENAYVNVSYNRTSLPSLTASDFQIYINNTGAGMFDPETGDYEGMYSNLVIELGSLTGLDTWNPSQYKYGEYEIYIPAGLLIDQNGNTNSAQTLTYQIRPEDYNNVIDPLPQESQLEPGIYNRSELEDVVITFGGKFIAINHQSDPITYSNWDSGLEGALNSTYITVSDDYTELHLSIGGFEYGTYNFFIPAGYLILNDGESINGAIYMTYTIFNGLSQPIVIEAPAEVCVKNQIDPLTLSWDYEMVSFSGKVGNATITYYDKNYDLQTIDIPSSAFTWSTENNTGEGQGNVLSIDINSVLKDMTGTFTITLPEGFVETWDLNDSPELTYTIEVYDIYGAGDPVFAQYEKNVLKLTWKNAASYQNVASSPSMYVTNGDTVIEIPYSDWQEDASVYLERIEDWDWESETFGQLLDTYYLINLNKLGLTNGTWTLVAPEAWTTITDSKDNVYLNSQATYTFLWDGNFAGQTSGVEGLEVEDANAPVVYYNLQGQVVNNPEKGQILIKKQGTKTSKVVY